MAVLREEQAGAASAQADGGLPHWSKLEIHGGGGGGGGVKKGCFQRKVKQMRRESKEVQASGAL